MTPGFDRLPTGLEFAQQWAQLPPEHLRIALKALEPQLAREHAYRMAKERLAHRLLMTGLIMGFGLSLVMLVAAVLVGLQGQSWLAALFSGPSMVTLVGMFVLRKFEFPRGRAIKAPLEPSTSSGPAPEPDAPAA
ncbi:hypothetical protein AB0C14_26670 [Microbispora hainanensis]|uniref:hypothetical protein n=1 Tax=Microbispora hainanensis TaxID=568844 RepID=UPI0033E8AC0F